ncbi:MAG TPA: M23 family metallopeptidase [Methylomirabilota bacterium]|nr:M23 family metallopeptidase [Methylomirabilota bacterium]
MFRVWKVWIVLLVLLGLAGGFVLWRQRQPLVAVNLDPAFTALGHPKRTVTMRLRAPAGGLRSVEARVIQGGTARVVLTEAFASPAPREADRPLNLEAAALGLKEGDAELQVFARDTVWRLRQDPGPRLTHRFAVDLTPPTLELRSATGYIKHAGAGIAVYRVAGASRSGVQVGAAFFPGVAGLTQDPAVHVALFTIPYHGAQTPPSLFAEDEAGNQRLIGVPVTFLPVRFPKDTIRLTEAFLQRKVPELAPQTPGTATGEQLLQAFLTVNRDGRKAAEAKIRELSQTGSAPKPLWQGVFRQQPNTKVFANFPEERTYLADGRTVDTQWHLGIDLASRKQSPVDASNAGRVVFTGFNGIYGNMVVLDHGLGLFTLYGHLSEIAVKAGQTVAKGEALGRSGETGLAGGDHLHFAMLIHGVYTSPLEWWDEHWIRDRIAKPLADAGIAVAGVTDGALAPAPAAASTPAAPRSGRRARAR